MRQYFLVWLHSAEDINLFFNHINNNDKTKNIQFTIEAAEEFLDLKLRFDKEHKHISADIFAKATSSFEYILPSTCFPKSRIRNVPKGVAAFRRIYDFVILMRSLKNAMSCNNNNFSASCNLITQYTPLIPNITTIIKNHLPVLHSHHEMLNIFSQNTVDVTYSQNQHLKEFISPSSW